MVEQIPIQHKKTIWLSVVLSLLGLPVVAMILLLFRNVCLRNSYTGASLWGILFFLGGLVLIIGAAMSKEVGSSVYWVLFFFFFFPLLMTGFGLIGGKGNQEAYLKDMDILLSCLVRRKVFSLKVLEKNLPESDYVKALQENRIIYMLKDLEAAGVLSFQHIDDKVTVRFLLPVFKEMVSEVFGTCPNCGAAIAENLNAEGYCVCEYCGSLIEK